MPLDPGTKLGSYEVTAPLGAGGMGEVYRAADAKLGREVAIKILPEEFARQPDRLARFEREAKVLASLNHPNIAAIYGLEESDGLRCLVLELVEGKTLLEMIEAGPLPVEQALGYALQIAEALEAAHDKGIIHRDLKPANVKVTPEGKVKVLDFGLAKAFTDEPATPADASMSPTLTVAATQAGIIMGTAAYMSPEQAAGQGADRRSDIWSFGVVILEMLTGRRTFEGETASHVLASVLKDDPPLEKLPAGVPPRLREMIATCLRKKPRRRLQAIGDARVLLEEYHADPAAFESAPADVSPTAPTAAPAKGRWIPWAVAGLLAAALAAVSWGLLDREPARRGSTRLSLPGPNGEFLFQGYGSSVALSPDGSLLAYVLDRQQGRQLYIRPLDRWEPDILVPGELEPYHPFFSPDGQWVGFVTRTELKKVPVRGGSPLTLCAVDRSRGASWAPDGTIVFAPSPSSGLHRVAAAGGEPEEMTVIDEESQERSHRWPQVLPGGEAVLFTSISGSDDFDQAKLELFFPGTKERRVVHQGGSYGRYVGSGHIIYMNRGTLFAFPFDLDSMEATGSPAPVLEGLASNRNQGGAHYDVAADGTLAYAAGKTGTFGTTVVWVEPGGQERSLWDQAQEYGNPMLSPDGSRLTVDVASEGASDIWVHDLARGVPMRLTFDDGRDANPVWSPDGAFIYFVSERDGGRGIYRRASDGSGEVEKVLDSEKPLFPSSVSPDGGTLAITQGGDIVLVPLDGGEPEPFQAGPAIEGHPRFSPDGRWIAYNSNESGPFQVYVRPAAGGRGKWQISTDPSAYPHWAGDGRAIYYRTAGQGLVKVPVDTSGGTFRASRPEQILDGPYQFTADGVDRFTVHPGEERFVMLREPEAFTGEHQHLRVVLNWFEDLERTFAGSGGL